MLSSAGVRQGHVIIMRRKHKEENYEDGDRVRIEFQRLGFDFREPNKEFQHKDRCMEYLEEIEKEADKELDILLLYIAAEELNTTLIDASGRSLYVKEIAKVFNTEKMKDIKILLFLQMNLEDKSKRPLIFVNIVKVRKVMNYAKSIRFPRNKNFLVLNLPKKFVHLRYLTDILCQQLSQPVDLDTALSYVVYRAVNLKDQPTPMYYSTMVDRLYLHQMELKQKANILFNLKKVAYAFVFEKYGKETKLPTYDGEEDERSMASAFRNLGFGYECKRGEIQADEISKGMHERNDALKNNCDVLCVVISSYGDRTGVISASDKEFILKELLGKFKEWKSIPKLFIVDGGRMIGGTAYSDWRNITPDNSLIIPQNSFLIMSYLEGGTQNDGNLEPEGGEMTQAPASFLAELCRSMSAAAARGEDVDVIGEMHGVMSRMEEGRGEVDDSADALTLRVGYASTLRTQLCFRTEAVESNGQKKKMDVQDGEENGPGRMTESDSSKKHEVNDTKASNGNRLEM